MISTLPEYIDYVEKLDSDWLFSWKDNCNSGSVRYAKLLNDINKFTYDKNTETSREQTIANFEKWLSEHREELYALAFYERYYKSSTQVSKFYFRGIPNVKYLNAPGIYRKDLSKEKSENYFYNEIQVRCPASFAGMKNINKLTYMQHYGCPTRLLDISSNPLVALYFACLDQDDSDGMVYVFGVPDGDIHYEQSDRVQMLSKLVEFNKTDQEKILVLAYFYLFKGKFPQQKNGKYVDPIIERFYHAIKRDNGAFEREIVPLDLLNPLFVQVNKDNPRILKQDGAFIVSGLSFDETDCDAKIGYYTSEKIQIHAKCKAELRKQLAKVCINQASLFPEVEQVASYLRHIK